MRFVSTSLAGRNEADLPCRKAYAVRCGKVNPALGSSSVYIDLNPAGDVCGQRCYKIGAQGRLWRMRGRCHGASPRAT